MTYKNSNTAARTSFSFRSKQRGNEKLFLAAVFEFGYIITALVFFLFGTGQDTFTLMSLLDQILSAEFFSKVSKLLWR